MRRDSENKKRGQGWIVSFLAFFPNLLTEAAFYVDKTKRSPSRRDERASRDSRESASFLFYLLS